MHGRRKSYSPCAGRPRPDTPPWRSPSSLRPGFADQGCCIPVRLRKTRCFYKRSCDASRSSEQFANTILNICLFAEKKKNRNTKFWPRSDLSHFFYRKESSSSAKLKWEKKNTNHCFCVRVYIIGHKRGHFRIERRFDTLLLKKAKS